MLENLIFHPQYIESQWKFEILAHHQMGICATIMIHGDFRSLRLKKLIPPSSNPINVTLSWSSNRRSPRGPWEAFESGFHFSVRKSLVGTTLQRRSNRN